MAKIFRQKINKNIILFLFVLLLGSFLRLYRLTEAPISLFGDELDVGYQAYSILKTGRDYMGQFVPVYIRSLTEWRAPLLMYVTVPSVAIFGLNEWGVRIPPAIFGILNVLFIYLLIKELSASGGKNELWAVLGALLLAINPWSIHYGRAAFEVTLLLFLILAGFYCFLKGLKNPWFFIGSVILFGLTPFAYSTANVFLPLLIFSLLIVYRKELVRLRKQKVVWLSLAIFILVLIPIAKELLFGQAGGRFGLISVFSDQKIVEEIHLRRLGGISFDKPVGKVSFLERIFTNRPVYWALAISQNYLSAFSLDFLFAHGDPYFRHSISKVGEFYFIEIVFVTLGALAWLKLKDKRKWLIFVWLLLAPIPSSLTKDGGNHATRLFLMIPPITILSAYGLVQLMELAKKKKIAAFFLFFVSCLLLFNFSFYLHRYFVHYSKESWRYWHYGYKQAMGFIVEHQDEYGQILINNIYEPSLLRYLFWTKYDPEEFQQKFTGDKPKENILPGFDGFKLGEVYFGKPNKEDWWDEILTPDVLYLASQKDDVGGDWDWRKNPPSGVKVLETASNPYNQPIFYLVTHE